MVGTTSFVFHGGVFPFAARLEGSAPVHVSKGAVPLTRVGGTFAEIDSSWDLPGFAGFAPGTVGRVERRVSGGREANGFTTRVTCSISDLVMPGLLRAELLEAELVSRYAGDEHTFEETVNVQGLQVAGTDCVLDSAILGAVKGRTLAQLKPQVSGRSALVETGAGGVACTFVQPQGPLRVKSGGAQVDIFVGEYAIGEADRRLTMLHLEVGPDPTVRAAEPIPRGSLVVMELIVNGHKPP